MGAHPCGSATVRAGSLLVVARKCMGRMLDLVLLHEAKAGSDHCAWRERGQCS